MPATTGVFTEFNSFKNKLGRGAIDLSIVSRMVAYVHHSSGGLSADMDISGLAEIASTASGCSGGARRAVTGVTWQVTGVSQFEWGSDAIVWTATSDADMTIKYCVFGYSVGNTVLAVGYIQLVPSDELNLSRCVIKVAPNPAWFKLS